MKKNSFWNTCPKTLEYFPEKICDIGKLGAESKKEPKSGCPWFINSEEDNFCFWTWVRRNSNKEGSFEPLLQHQMSTLMGVSGTKIHFVLKEALSNLKDSKNFKILEELINIPE